MHGAYKGMSKKYFNKDTKTEFFLKLGEELPSHVVELSPDNPFFSPPDEDMEIVFEDGLPTRAKKRVEKVQTREEKISIVHFELAEELRGLSSQYTKEEVDTWPMQEAEAKEYLALGEDADTPILDAMEAVGHNKEDLVESILTKTQEYKSLLGTALGMKRKKLNEL